jgi:NAD(P)-dependent dehydrogenase (short-subunit alcohol dehydrogenase family)
MVEREHPGRIIFTGGSVQEVPGTQLTTYSATRAGLRMPTRSMVRGSLPTKLSST